MVSLSLFMVKLLVVFHFHFFMLFLLEKGRVEGNWGGGAERRETKGKNVLCMNHAPGSDEAGNGA